MMKDATPVGAEVLCTGAVPVTIVCRVFVQVVVFDRGPAYS